MTIETRNPNDLRIDGGTQFRVVIDEAVVKDYAAKMKEGKRFPAVVAFQDSDGVLWLGDGFHRHAAAVLNNADSIEVDVRSGTRRDAILFSLSANAEHGLRRTNDDIRKAVAFCLRDPELRLLGQREIAALCGCTQGGVSKIKNDLFPGTKQAKGKAAKKAADGAAAPPADNGYQPLDTPEQIVAAIKADERGSVLDVLIKRSATLYGEDKTIKRLERLGLVTVYGDSYQRKLEWTALADDVLELLLGGDDWTKFEFKLFKADKARRQTHHTVKFGNVKPLLEMLASAADWVSSSKMGWEFGYWIEPLIEAGYILTALVGMKEKWDNRTFYHLDVPGYGLLGIEDMPEIQEPPTREQLEAADKAREVERKAERERMEAERRATIDPAKEAERERKGILDYYFQSVENSVKNCQYLDVTEAKALLKQFMAAVNKAGLKTAMVAAAETAEAS